MTDTSYPKYIRKYGQIGIDKADQFYNELIELAPDGNLSKFCIYCGGELPLNAKATFFGDRCLARIRSMVN